MEALERLCKEKEKESKALDEDRELSEYFGESPPDGRKHYIIVQIPRRESIYCRGVVHRSHS